MAEGDLEKTVLSTLKNESEIADSWAYAEKIGQPHTAVVGVIKSLLVDAYISAEPTSTNFYALTEEGEQVVQHGSPEVRVFRAIPEGGLPLSQLPSIEQAVGKAVHKVGYNECMKNKWIKLEKAEKKVYPVAKDVVDEVAELVKQLKVSGGDPNTLNGEQAKTLKRRQMVTLITRKGYAVKKGPNFSLERKKQPADLTKEMLDSGNWKDAKFKEYNLKTLGKEVGGGYLHPLMKVRAEFRRILMEMGFEEMPTQRWVESSFWNFDSLFQPQSHPARDAHDTFFLKKPEHCNSFPEDYYERVKTIHESGGFGSIGYQTPFKREEATKNILRTHTTAISSQMLYKLANQPGGFTPKKYFSIDRVFRNETMDATHLAEFHQVEGLVADYDLSLGDLIGTIQTFFAKTGITELRFKPAYNPYTEPSMEIFGYSNELKKWMELGNSGIFRPEMVRPMGLPENVNVIAWGLSLERPTMIKYKISNIRDLFGHKIALESTKKAGVVRFE